MKFIVICSLIFLVSGVAEAGQVSLIDSNLFQGKKITVEEKSIAHDPDMTVDIEQESTKNDEIDQMNDFIDQENEKLKTIKLLNLDLERADLELKKKEIEQKISQLDKSQNSSVIGVQKIAEDEESVRPDVKLVSIFKSQTRREAVLRINGINFNAHEGQNLNGVVLKSIDFQAVTIEYDDGEIQNIQIL